MSAHVDDYRESVAAFLDRMADDPQDPRAAAPVLLRRAFESDIGGDSVAVLGHLLTYPPGDGFADATLAELFGCALGVLHAALLPLYEYGFAARLENDSGPAVTVLEWAPATNPPPPPPS